MTETCPQCERELKKDGECPNGCDPLTARAPDRDDPAQDQIGVGCFIKRKAVIE